MSKNVAVFVDVANIFYAAKAAGVDIDYVTLLKSASAGRDLVRAYAYTGLDPDNENQRNFHDFLRRSNYKVVSKDIRKYGDGKVKANLDIELVVDMMKTARNLDIAIVVSGDGDFAPAIRAVQEMGVRVEVISFKGNTSSDLIEAADLFMDITQLARVEKGTRSGRRVADDGDLSMTEVPDKQTEGTGIGRGRGTRGGRGRGRPADETNGTEASRSRGGRGRGRPVEAAAADGAAPRPMPGERLSRAGGLTEADLAAAEVFTLDDLGGEPLETAAGDIDRVELDGDDAPRRRRRRGGRGRGRGRGRDEVGVEGAAVDAVAGPDQDLDDEPDEDEIQADAAAAAAAAPRGPRTTPFGSVWDSQIGTPSAPVSGLAPLADDEDFDEPEIPEYLIAEQRRGSGSRSGGGGGRGGARGGRAAYQSAIARERYGTGGGGGGINRYPDVSGRTGQGNQGNQGNQGGRSDRGPSRPRDDRPRDDRPRDDRPRSSGGSEPWSDVPPELEAMLRAQVAQKPEPASRPESVVTDADAPAKAAPKRRTTRLKTPATTAATAEATPADAEAPAKAAPKRRTTKATAAEAATAATDAEAPAKAAPKRRTTKAATAEATTADAEAPVKAAPKRRTTRLTTKKVAASDVADTTESA